MCDPVYSEDGAILGTRLILGALLSEAVRDKQERGVQTEVVKTRMGANKGVQSKGNQMSKLTARAVSMSSAARVARPGRAAASVACEAQPAHSL